MRSLLSPDRPASPLRPHAVPRFATAAQPAPAAPPPVFEALPPPPLAPLAATPDQLAVFPYQNSQKRYITRAPTVHRLGNKLWEVKAVPKGGPNREATGAPVE